MKNWFIYILKCSDNSLYTGATDNVTQRIEKHNLGKGAKYTRSRLPVQLVLIEECATKSKALKRELEIKQLKRHEKLQLIAERELIHRGL